MAKKRATSRTLRTGERVTYQGDGTRHLVPADPVGAALDSTEDEMRRADAAKTAARLAAVRAKRESLAAGDAVPDDKRVV